MAAERSGPHETDRHGWNSYENYVQVHEARLEHHPFVDQSRPNTIAFEFFDFEGDIYIVVNGTIFCHHDVVLEVTKILETRYTQDGRLQVRTFSYRYNASVRGRHNILRYDNGHDFDEYHGHWFDIETGEPTDTRSLTRQEFPLLSEVLDELGRIFEGG